MNDLNLYENVGTDMDGDTSILEDEVDFIDALCEYLAQGDALALEWLDCFLS